VSRLPPDVLKKIKLRKRKQLSLISDKAVFPSQGLSQQSPLLSSLEIANLAKLSNRSIRKNNLYVQMLDTTVIPFKSDLQSIRPCVDVKLLMHPQPLRDE